jgi:hypothetical protein
LRFTDARFNDGSHSIVAFSAKLGDDEWGETQTVCATCEVELKGAEGVRLTVLCPSLHPGAKATDPKQREGASVASRGGVASIDVEADGWRVVVGLPRLGVCRWRGVRRRAPRGGDVGARQALQRREGWRTSRELR